MSPALVLVRVLLPLLLSLFLVWFFSFLLLLPLLLHLLQEWGRHACLMTLDEARIRFGFAMDSLWIRHGFAPFPWIRTRGACTITWENCTWTPKSPQPINAFIILKGVIVSSGLFFSGLWPSGSSGMQTTLGRSLDFYAPFPEARFCGPRAWRWSLRREGWGIGLGFLGAPWGGCWMRRRGEGPPQQKNKTFNQTSGESLVLFPAPAALFNFPLQLPFSGGKGKHPAQGGCPGLPPLLRQPQPFNRRIF